MTDENLVNDENLDQVEDSDQDREPLEKRCAEYLAGWQRAKADYLNFKKETEKRQIETIQFANAALIAELLPIFDHFKTACNHIPAEQKAADWVVGFIHIKNQLVDFFKNIGIEEIKTVGEKFDPNLHEAVAHEANPDFTADVIFEEVKAGYTLQGKVLQPAKVKVTK